MTRQKFFLAGVGLLAVSAVEARAGRILRAPDGHSQDEHPEQEEGKVEGVETLPGGVQRAVAQEAPAAEEEAKPGLPEGYDSWEKYGQDVLSGKVKPAGTETSEGDATQKDDQQKPALTDEQLAEVVKTSTEGMTPEMAKAVTPFVESFAKNGTLTDAEVTEAAKATGFSEAMVRQYMDGALYQGEKSAAEGAAQVKPFHDLFGGEAQYGDFQKWAGENLSKAEQAAFNEALDKSPTAALTLAETFKARYEAQGGGGAPRDLTAGRAQQQGGSVEGYASQAEMTAAMEDPRYRNDPAYRAKVEARVGASNFN